jgi:hypothetical protein
MCIAANFQSRRKAIPPIGASRRRVFLYRACVSPRAVCEDAITDAQAKSPTKYGQNNSCLVYLFVGFCLPFIFRSSRRRIAVLPSAVFVWRETTIVIAAFR